MDSYFSIILMLLTATMFVILLIWLYFLIYAVKSFKQSPKLESFNQSRVKDKIPKISIILPARNEENYISKCLDGLLKQNYPNFEIVAVNDSSSDRTLEIMQECHGRSSKVVVIDAEAKPEGWAGKSWPYYQGYLRSSGDIFFFVDADTIYSPSTLSLAVGHLIEEKLDALAATPRIFTESIWTKITTPLAYAVSYYKYSPLRANNPKIKFGYVVGCFCLITRKAYEAVGTHKAVKNEMAEDIALGQKVKEQKFKIKVVRGEDHVTTAMRGDFRALWNDMQRVMIPQYHKNKTYAILITVAVFFLLFEPFLLLPFSLFFLSSYTTLESNLMSQILRIINLVVIAVLVSSSAIQSKVTLVHNPIYILATPLAGAIISIGFISAIINARKKDAINYRGRRYTFK